MKTPNPRGCTNSSNTWERMKLMKPENIVHWSFNEKLRTRARKAFAERTAADATSDAMKLLQTLMSKPL